MEWEKAGSPQGDGNVAQKKKRGVGRIIVIVVAAALLFMLIRGCSSGSGDKPEKLDWPTSGLASMLPDPPSTYGSIKTDDAEQLSVDFDEVSSDDAKAYIEACKDLGFTADATESNGNYQAFDSEGYGLDITYWSSNKNLSVSLDAPMVLEALAWPTSGPATLLPKPNTTMGRIELNSSETFGAYLGQMDSATYTAYVDECVAAGFDVDFDRGDTYYAAQNGDGVKLRLEYRGASVVWIKVESPQGVTAAENQEEQEPASDAQTDTGVESSASADFRASMDSLEEFFNKYVDFMNSYDTNDPLMLVEYGEMMTQYADAMGKIEAIDEGTLSAEDLAYYTEVMGRINQKLLEVA